MTEESSRSESEKDALAQYIASSLFSSTISKHRVETIHYYIYALLFSFGSLRKVGRISEIFPIFARHLVRAPLFDLRKSNEIIFGFRPFRNSAIIKFVIFFHCVVNEKKVSIFCSLFI